jgi:hypothetical protein
MKKILANLFLVVCFFAAGCTISGNLKNAPGSTLLVAQASPTSELLDMYVNGVKYLSNISYTSYSGYKLVPAGSYMIDVNIANTDTVLLPPLYGELTIPLQTGLHYSFFLVDSINAIQGVLLQDNLNAPTGNFARIRFMQFSPLGDSTSLDSVYFSAQDTMLSAYRFFNDQNSNQALDSFVNIAAGPHNFAVTFDSTFNNIILNQTDTLVAGKIYTFVLTGLQNFAGTPYGLQAYLVKHN